MLIYMWVYIYIKPNSQEEKNSFTSAEGPGQLGGLPGAGVGGLQLGLGPSHTAPSQGRPAGVLPFLGPTPQHQGYGQERPGGGQRPTVTGLSRPVSLRPHHTYHVPVSRAGVPGHAERGRSVETFTSPVPRIQRPRDPRTRSPEGAQG